MVAKNATVIGHFVKKDPKQGHDDATLVFVLEVILWKYYQTGYVQRKQQLRWGQRTCDVEND